MGWLFPYLGDFLWALIRYPFVKLTDSIDELGESIDVMRIRVQQGFATGLENGWLGIGLTFFKFTAAIFLARIGQEFTSWWGSAQTQLNAQLFFDKLSISEAALAFEQARLFSEIAKELLPEWREVTNGVYAAISGMSKIIYDSTHQMSTWLISSRNLVYSAAIMFGANPNDAEIAAYGASEPWISKVNQRASLYADRPYLIMEHLREEVINPAMQELSKERAGQLAAFTEAYFKVVELTDNFQAFSTATKSWIDAQPEYLANYLRENTEPIFTYIDDSIAFFQDSVLAPIGNSIDIINESIATLQLNYADIQARWPTLEILTYKFFSLDPAEREDVVNILRDLINQDLMYARQTIAVAVNQNYNDYKADLYKLYRKGFEGLADDTKLPITGRAAPVPAVPTGSWFVGEF